MDGLEKLDSFLKTKAAWPKVMFAKVWGSRSHHTEIDGSDWDFSGVYVAPTRSVLSFRHAAETLDGKDPDFSFHEAGKFCTLLLKGNFGIVEMLFTERMYRGSPEWDWLKSQRKKFLSKQVVKQYIGFSEGNLKDLRARANGSYDLKAGYHLIRVLQDALRIVRGGEPIVWKEGEQRDFLLRIRNGEFSFKELDKMAGNILAEIKSCEPWQLPDRGDEDALEEWLVAVRMRNL